MPTHRGVCLPPLAAQSKGVLAVLAQLKRALRDAAAGGRGDGAPPPPSSSASPDAAAAATEATPEHHAAAKAKLSDSLAAHAAAAADDGSGSEKDYSATMRLMDGVEVGRGRRDGLVVWRMKIILPLTFQRSWWWPVGGTAHAVELNIGRLREHRPSVVSNAGRRRGVARGLAKAVTCCRGEVAHLLRDDWDASSRRFQVSADVVLESRCGGAAHDGNSETAASALDVAARLAAGKTVRELSGVRLSNATAGFDGSSSQDGGSASLAEFATRSALEPADDGGDGGGGGGGGGALPVMRVHKRLRVDLYSECGVCLLRFPRLSGAAMPPPTVRPMNNAPYAKQNTPRATPWIRRRHGTSSMRCRMRMWPLNH